MLDAATAETVRTAIVSATRRRTMVVVEHRIGPWLEHVDRVVVLSADGQVVADGDVASFLAGPPPPGVWAPGLPTPTPLDVPRPLVEPRQHGPQVVLDRVSVDLVLRTLRGTRRTRAIRDLDALVPAGQVSAFTGPSGAGKSTALGVVGGLIRVAAGTVTPDLRSMRSQALAAVAGWVPQNPEHGFLTRTVADEVAHTGRRLGVAVDVAGVLDVFGLGRFGPSNPYRLSGGEQRRLAIAAGLAHRPGLVLLDEPTVGQDPSTWAAVTGWIEAARGTGATVAVSTHDADLRRDVEIQMMAEALQ
jgi:energy-coupling factor transporter ATP-binding protein EcfA2